MDLGIRNKVVLISGGTQGIGLAAAQSFLKEGAKVAVFSRDSKNVQSALDILETGECAVLGFTCDLANDSAVDEMLIAVRKDFGEIDIFVGSSGGPAFSPAEELSKDDLVKALNINLISLVTLTNKLLPSMKKSRWGRVVYVTTSGVVMPVPNLALSNIARSGLTSFAKTLSNEVASEGVTVNSVVPGRINTDRLQQVLKKEADSRSKAVEEIIASNMRDIPAARYGSPQEIADVITFLCSQAASYVTGVKIPVDGGMIKVT